MRIGDALGEAALCDSGANGFGMKPYGNNCVFRRAVVNSLRKYVDQVASPIGKRSGSRLKIARIRIRCIGIEHNAEWLPRNDEQARGVLQQEVASIGTEAQHGSSVQRRRQNLTADHIGRLARTFGAEWSRGKFLRRKRSDKNRR